MNAAVTRSPMHLRPQHTEGMNEPSMPFMFAPGRASRQIAVMVKPVKQRSVQQPLADNTSVPDPAWRWLIAALIAATASLAYPAVAGSFLVNLQSEQYIAGYAFRDFTAQSLRSGQGFPQWNSFMFGGMPYAAAKHGAVFYPTFLLQFVMRTDLAITWGFVCHLLLAGLFTVGFLRSIGLSRWAATFGALAYMLSGPVASNASPGDEARLFVSALLPLALWMLTRAVRDTRAYAWGVFALTVGLAALSAHAQMLQYFLLTCGAYALFLTWASARNETALRDSVETTNSIRITATRLGAALGMVVLGLSIAAIQYWPALGYVASSAHANGADYSQASSFSLPPEEMLNSYLPQFSGILQRYWGRNQINLRSEYLGVVVLMFAPLAFGKSARTSIARFCLGAGAVSLLWALGSYTPFFRIVYAMVPGTRYFNAPSAAFSILTFMVCVLSALGFERVVARHVSGRFLSRYLAAWCAFGALLIALAVSGALNIAAHRIVQNVEIVRGHDPEYLSRAIDHNERALLMGAFRSFAVVLMVALMLYAYQTKRLRTSLFAAALLATTGVDAWSIARRYWIFSKPAAELFQRDAIISHLRTQQQPGRVFVYTKTSDYRTATDPYFGAGGFGEGGGLMVHGIRSVSGYHRNPLARYDQLMAQGALIDPAFWQHENVRWLYTNAEIADTVLKKVDGPISNSGGSTVVLYEMPGNNSYAWVASSFGGRNDTAAVKELLEASYNPRTFVSVAAATKINGVSVAPAPALFSAASTITTSISDFGAGRATVHLSAPAEAGNALVISENFYKGWRAEADGKGLPVMRASFNLVGVALPAGTQTVSFTFRDERYATGRLVTLIALLLTGCLILLGWRRHQKSVPFADASRTTRDGAV